jgi:hypothetical protein
MKHNRWTLWRRWVIANALGEMIGLGATLAVGAWFISGLEQQSGMAMALLSFLVAVASGAIEATVVGLAQWWAMRPGFPTIAWHTWWLATLIGALIAYVLGYLPSTIMNLGEESGQAPMAEPPQWIVLLLAAGLGIAGGAVLSFAQWQVLRKHASGAGWWIPAHMLAWAAGMPLIFWGIDAAQKGQPLWQTVLVLAGVLLAMGALVGAIHGAALVWLVKANPKKISFGSPVETSGCYAKSAEVR